MTTPEAQLLPSAYIRAATGLADIERTVAEAFGVTVAEMHRRSRERRIVWPRQVAMWLMCRTTNAIATEIDAIGHVGTWLAHY